MLSKYTRHILSEAYIVTEESDSACILERITNDSPALMISKTSYGSEFEFTGYALSELVGTHPEFKHRAILIPPDWKQLGVFRTEFEVLRAIIDQNNHPDRKLPNWPVLEASEDDMKNMEVALSSVRTKQTSMKF